VGLVLIVQAQPSKLLPDLTIAMNFRSALLHRSIRARSIALQGTAASEQRCRRAFAGV